MLWWNAPAMRWRAMPCRLWLGLTLLVATQADATVDQPALRPWNDYRVIMWIGDSAYRRPDKVPLFFQRLREMGINTAMVLGDDDPRPLLDNGFPYYVENIITRGLFLKRNSPVADWPKFVATWAGTRDRAALVRPYGLDDPQWREWTRQRMQAVVRTHRANHPVAYNIRDELSVTFLSNPFDYDFSPATLAKFRQWLTTQYADLAALNREWETGFATWDEVVPFTTDEIKQRMASGAAGPHGTPDWRALKAVRFDPASARRTPTRWNFAPWADFRTYMDVALANVLADLRAAAHAIDPQTPVGIEGTQMPSAFGGFDLWRLAQAVDWVEPYDVGSAREIFGSFMPDKPLLSTIDERDTKAAVRHLWHALLRGDRGVIVWWSEDCIDWRSDDLALTAKAQALAPALRVVTTPLAKLMLRAQRIYDPIAVHYSQPSIQVDWLLESAADGADWVGRFTSYEETHNRMAQLRNSWLQALQDLGYSPRFVSAAQIEGGTLRKDGWRVLIMPQSLALSEREVAEIRAFVETGERVALADTPVLFDEHGKLRPTDPFGTRAPAVQSIGDYASQRLTAMMPALWSWLADRCRAVPREVVLTSAPSSRTRIHRYRIGNAKLIAFERNVEYDLRADVTAAGGNKNLDTPVELTARLATAAHVYDLRTNKYLGFTDTLTFTLDPWQPSLYALLPQPAPAESVVELLLKQSS